MRCWLIGLAILLLAHELAAAHPMPNSVVKLNVGSKFIAGDIAVPLIELDLAMGTDFRHDPIAAVTVAQDRIRDYFAEHLRVATPDGSPWTVSIKDIDLQKTIGDANASYVELTAKVVMSPPEGTSVRALMLNYDAVIHKVATHSALVIVGEDWLTGQIDVHGDPIFVGVIRVNPIDNTIAPLPVNLSKGSYWRGFLAMLQLGMSHISEGTDHILFLLTLLLPAPLLPVNGRWNGKACTRGALFYVFKIVTAFTIGHSMALIIASLLRLNLSHQPIEVIIAGTILVSAIHVLRPIFPGRGFIIAGMFGLVHGMAFSFTLAALNLSTAQLVVSLVGFNLGIELFQLAIVALVLPSMLLFAGSGYYAPVRIAGSVIAMVASVGWIADRLDIDWQFLLTR